MRPIDEREKVLNMHFIEKKSAEKICAEVGIPLGSDIIAPLQISYGARVAL